MKHLAKIQIEFVKYASIAENLYQQYWQSDRGKKVYNKALKKYPFYNKGISHTDKAVDAIMADVEKWIDKEKYKNFKSILKQIRNKVLDGIT